MLRFGRFTLDPARHALYRDGTRVHLTSKPLETLIYLVAHRGHPVSKQELLDAIWSETAVTDDTLVQAVHEIRKALEDDKTDPRFLQTVPRHGYRFVGEVIEVDEAPAAAHLRMGAPVDAAPPVMPRGAADTRWWLWRAGALLVTLLMFVSVWVVWSFRSAASGGAVATSMLEQLTSESLSAGKPMFSPDGNIVYNAGGALHIRFAGSDTSIQITDRILPSGDMPVFTADGRHVVFSLPRNGEDGSRVYDLYQVAAIGGSPALFIPEASGAGFSPDGKWVAYTKYVSGRPVLWISPVDDLERHVEVRPGGFVPRWSPDGRWIAYTNGDPNATSGDVWMASVSTERDGDVHISDHIQLTNDPQAMYGLSWARDGRSVVFAGRRPGGPTHLYRVRTSGGVTALTSGAGDYACPSVSPDGKRLIFWHGTPVKNLMTADDHGASPLRAIGEDEYHLWPRLSPAATHVASVIRRPTYEERLYVTEIASGRRVALSAHPARHPAWLDASSIAYLEQTGARSTEARVVNLAAAESPIKLAEFRDHAAWVAVHPRRTSVAVVVTADDGRQRIVLRQIGGREGERTIVEGCEYEHLRWMPDGSALSWSGPERASDPESNGIWVVDPEHPSPRRIVADGYGPVWSADGSVVYYSRIREYSGLWQTDVRTGLTAQLRQWPEGHHEFDLVGERLVLTAEGGRGRVFAMAFDP